MWNQAHWFDRSLKTFLSRRRVDPRESFQRAVIACQAPETFLFSIFLWEGRELSFHRKACDAPFTMYTKFVPIFMQHRGIWKNARACMFMPFQRFLNALV